MPLTRFTRGTALIAALLAAVGAGPTADGGAPQPAGAHAAAPAASARQWWAGTLELPGPQGPIPVGIVISLAPPIGAGNAAPEQRGEWGATFDLIPGPGTFGMSAVECREVRVTDSEIAFTVPPPVATSVRLTRPAPGAPTATGSAAIEGVGEVPVSIRLVEESEAMTRIIPRPQTPRPPFPYAREEFTVSSPADELTLAGTLTIPSNPGPHPAVVLVSDAGMQDRDHAEGNHRLFLVIADHLTRRGVAVLRLDDRGAGASQGLYADATLDTLAADLGAALTALGQRPDIDAKRIGAVGLGDGALVAAMAAAADPAVSWLALLSPAGLPGKEVSLLRERRRMEAEGEDPSFIDAQLARTRKVFDLVTEGTDQETIAAAIGEVIVGAAKDLRGEGFAPPEWQVQETAAQQAFLYSSPAMRRWLSADPADTLATLRLPVLVLAGDLDLTMPPADHLPKVESALKGAPVEVRILPGLNHYLQPATTGFADEVSSIPTTIDPAALDALASWIEARAAQKP